MRRLFLFLVGASALLIACMPQSSSAQEADLGFWPTIATLEGGPEERAAMLDAILSRRSAEERSAFGLAYWQATDAAYSWDVWGAGYLLNGGMSDDSFDYFRAWLISQGEEVYSAALRDPDSLAAVATPDAIENEDFLYIATKDVTDADLKTLDLIFEPSGTPWTEADLPTRYPQIWSRVE